MARGVGTVLAMCLLGGCGMTGTATVFDPEAPSTARASQPDPVSEAADSAVNEVVDNVSPWAVPPDVDWSSGKGTPEQPAPDPSPTGWYEAAFGGTSSSQGRVLYLTLDDGPDTATLPILELLRQYEAKATFFVIGTQAASRPDVVEAIRQDGHALGNHTWSHPDLVGLSPEEVGRQLAETAQIADTGPCMRPPYGSIDMTSGNLAEDMQLQPIMWTAQAFDWKSTATSDQIVADLKTRTTPGAVVLVHDGGGDRSKTVMALEQLLPYWNAEGYELKAIPACQREG